MGIWELILIAIGLSMDAAAVSICKGLATGGVRLRHCLTAGAYFGLFQALMPSIGYALGSTFAHLIDRYDHWIAFILLALIGGNMLRETFGAEEEQSNASFGFAAMLPLAIATSIDALAVGVSFSLLDLTWGGDGPHGVADRVHHLRHFRSVGEAWRSVRRPFPEAGRICRRRDPDPDRH